MINGNPLHIMAKVAGQPRTQMTRLPWMSARRSPEALHWTVIPDQPGERWIPAVIGPIIAGLDASPFTLVFDQACGRTGGTAEIHCRHIPREARRLVAALRKAFRAADLVFSRGTRPHVTLDYQWSAANFDEAITPIVWEIDRLVLIESVQGKHIPHGTWPLVPRQGTLFPLLPCDRRGDADRRGTLATLPS